MEGSCTLVQYVGLCEMIVEQFKTTDIQMAKHGQQKKTKHFLSGQAVCIMLRMKLKMCSLWSRSGFWFRKRETSWLQKYYVRRKQQKLWPSVHFFQSLPDSGSHFFSKSWHSSTFLWHQCSCKWKDWENLWARGTHSHLGIVKGVVLKLFSLYWFNIQT